MSKVIKAKRVRKIKNVANVASVMPDNATLQIAFHAATPEDSFDDVKSGANEILVIDNEESHNERDILADYTSALLNAFKSRCQRDDSQTVIRDAIDVAKYMSNARVAKMLLDARVVPDFPVYQRVANAFFNIKSMQRMTQVLQFALRAAKCENHLRVIFKTAFALQRAEIEFSDVALDLIYNIKSSIPEKYTGKISRPDIIYTSGTRNAQQSMTLNALVKLNVFKVKQSETSRKPAYEIDLDNVISQALIQEMNLA